VKRTIRAEVVVPMHTFSYRPSSSLRTPGAVWSRKAQIHRRLHSLVEDPDLRPVADADDVALNGDLVPGAELEDLALVSDREGDFVGRHFSDLLVRSS
jgi:hypothetical protein